MRKSILILCSAILMVGCGGNKTKKELSISPQNLEVKGALKDYYEVEDKNYRLEEKRVLDDGTVSEYLLTIELKRTDVPFPFDTDKATSFSTNSGDRPIQVGFGIELLNENGDLIETKQASEGGWTGVYSSNDIENLIQLNAEETGIVRWVIYNGTVNDGVASFRITSALSGVSRVENTKSTSKSSEWNEVLDEYEKYIDQYIKMYKKAMDGDMSAITEYASMLEKAESLENKLKNAKDGTLTASQVKRMTKIQNKMISAMK